MFLAETAETFEQIDDSGRELKKETLDNMQRTNPFDPIHLRAQVGEVITMTTTSIQVPNQAVFGSLSSGTPLEVVGNDTATVKSRRFTMPGANTAYDVTYLFAPIPPPMGARYEVLFESSDGSSDHHTIHPDFNPFLLTYRFVVEGAGSDSASPASAAPAKKVAVAKAAAKKKAPGGNR